MPASQGLGAHGGGGTAAEVARLLQADEGACAGYLSQAVQAEWELEPLEELPTRAGPKRQEGRPSCTWT